MHYPFSRHKGRSNQTFIFKWEINIEKRALWLADIVVFFISVSHQNNFFVSYFSTFFHHNIPLMSLCMTSGKI